MSFQQELHEDQRLVILRTMAEMPGYQANESVLQMALDKLGHNISRSLVVSHLHYLQEHGALTLEDVCGIQVATLTSRGDDVAYGRATAQGVKRPRAR